MKSRTRLNAFTLVELLVVIGIIAVLIGILLPTMRQARLKGQQVVCQSNLKQLGAYMVMYCNANKGYMFPVGPVTPGSAPYASTLGTNVMPHLRWPVILFNVKYQGLTYPDDPVIYGNANSAASGSMATLLPFLAIYDATPFTPRVMFCPSDTNPLEAHSYVVNQEMVQNNNPVRFAGGNRGGRSPSEIITAGEKRNQIRDYHMERPATSPNPKASTQYGVTYASDFDRVVEPYRHGISYGSNYLFLDGHVATQLPDMAATQVDPWDVPGTVTTQPKVP